MKSSILLTVLCCFASACRADTVFLTDGSEVNGTIIDQSGSTVVVKLANGSTRSVLRKNIDSIIKESPKAVAKKVDVEVKIPQPPNSETPSTAPGKSPVASTTSPPAKLTAPVGLGATQPSGAPLTTPSIPPTTAPTTPPSTTPGATPPAVPDTAATPATTPPAGPKAIPATPDTPNNIVVTTPAPADSAPPAKPGEATGVPPIEGFPELAKRMTKRKESLFRDAIEAIKGTDESVREAAILDVQGLSGEVVPYCWAGVQNENASVRVACMRVLGALNARNATKRVIETLYMTMPETSQAATWNVPFVRVIKNTLASLTGQSFIAVEPKSVGVQEGLRKYIDWYEKNFDRLPRQVNEPDLDPTAPDYPKKVAEVRKLKLMKRDWPRPGAMPVDLISGPNNTTPGRESEVIKNAAEREADKKFLDTIPKVGRDEPNKRDAVPVPTRDGALKRDNELESMTKRNAERDPAGSGEKSATKPSAPRAADALKRPGDLKREEEQKDRNR